VCGLLLRDVAYTVYFTGSIIIASATCQCYLQLHAKVGTSDERNCKSEKLTG